MITTHVLDTAARHARARHRGRARARRDGQWHLVGGGVTDDDGRLRTLTPAGPGAVPARTASGSRPARTSRETGSSRSSKSSSSSATATQHYHVPLLLSRTASRPTAAAERCVLSIRGHVGTDLAPREEARQGPRPRRARADAVLAIATPATAAHASPCTRSTAARTCSRAETAEEARRARAARARRVRARRARRSPRRIGMRGDLAGKVLERVREKLRARARRGLPHRLRGRLRQPPRRRGGRPRGRRPRSKSRAGIVAGTLPPFIGIRIKPLTRELARALAAHARRVPHRARSARRTAACPRTSSSRCRRSRATTDVEALVDVFELLEDRLDLDAGALQARDHGRDHADDLRPAGPLDAAAPPSRRRGPHASARTSEPTTTPRTATSPPRTRRCATRRATSPST